ncbi:MAG: HPr family phosphocarrier protein [Planctomycetota bacterium]
MIERENEASTGLGKGIAVPHVKHKAVKKTVAAIGQSSAGIDFSSLDKQPVYSVLLLLSPIDEPDKHLQAMENIFRHLQQDKFRRFLRQSRTLEDIKDLLQEADLAVGENTLETVVCEAEVEIKNADGLHMRPAMQFVDVASRFECDVTVSNAENTVDGKSIMQMSMLAATCRTRLKIKAEGADAHQAVKALRQLVEEKHFDEPLPRKRKTT